VNLLHAIIFGMVEGVSEFLSISSTGHLILTAQILKVSQSNFVKSFEIAIQLGAIFSVIVVYFKSLLVDLKIIRILFAAFIPTICEFNYG
jgi:undecaprenyl-diphosphatase